MSATNPDSGDVLVRLRGSLPGLQPAEQRVAQVVIRDPATAARMSITGMADVAATSVATVARFARKVGFPGYPDLRLALAGAAAREDMLGDGRHKPLPELDQTASLEDVVRSIAHHEARALEETAEHLSIPELQRAVDVTAAAPRIDLFGVGASAQVASDLQKKLLRIGRIAFAWKDVHSGMTAAALAAPGNVAIGFSHSGATVDTIEPLEQARASGATTIGITNFAGSPITRVADIVLTTAARETSFRSGATSSRTAQLAVGDILFVGVARCDLPAATSALSKTYDAVTGRRVNAREGSR